MILQKQPNRWSCLVTAFAMALDTPLDELIRLLGHDGSEIIFPNNNDPHNRRSFHPQEILDVAEEYYCKTFIVYEATPTISDGKIEIPIDMPKDRMYDIMDGEIGVIQGFNPNGNYHAIAWDGYNIFNPGNGNYNIKEFHILYFFKILNL